MKKKALLVAITSLSLAVGVTAGVLTYKSGNNSFAGAKDESYWYHYAQVTPTETKHGSKEFWANCSTHNFSLENPGVGEDIREGVDFATTSYFEELTDSDPRYLPPLSERVDIEGYLISLFDVFNHDPYSYIPNKMRPAGVDKVSESEVTYDFNDFVDVDDIKYGGYGEQWHMVIENIKESQRFYNVTTYGAEILNAANLVARTFLDSYYDNEVSKTFNNDSRFVAKIDFHSFVLTYNIQYISGITIPFFGTITPQIDMEYVIASSTKTVRIQLSENNALKFVITPDSYTFGLEYGVETVSRKAYFTISEDELDAVEGHIYEYVQYKDKDLIPACADFYIGSTYTSVVGNKASGILGFKGYINELYTTEDGYLRGYEVQETISLVKYNTLWFNFDDVTGFSNVKAIAKESYKENENPHNVYVNSDDTVFEPAYNKILGKKTSRKFDIEMRKQYFYGDIDEEIVEYEREIPMMFIQAGDNFNSYTADISETDGITSVVTLANTYLTKIQDDYATLIDIFIENKDNMPSASIDEFIGDAEVI